MWLKYLITIILFYLFAVLQNSFFAHFSLFGATPNLVFTLFFLLVFFEEKNNLIVVIFYAITAGLFLDFFSATYFGVSIILLLLIGFFVKKAQAMLQEKKDNKFPFAYFLPLFVASLLAYDLVFYIFLSRFAMGQVFLIFNRGVIAEIIYNLFFACIAFWVYKKFFDSDFDDRQLRLIK